MPPGCLLMGPMLHRLGRRRTLLLVNTPAVIGWLLIAMASHSEPWFLYQVYTGRILTGIVAGLVSTPAVVYVGEAMDKIWRGVLITWPSIGKRAVLAVSTQVPTVSEERCSPVLQRKVDRFYTVIDVTWRDNTK